MSKPKNQIVHLTHSRRKGTEVLFKLKPRDKQREIEKEIKGISWADLNSLDFLEKYIENKRERERL